MTRADDALDWADVAAAGFVARDWFDDFGDPRPVRSLLAHDRGAFARGLSVYQASADHIAAALREAYLAGKADQPDAIRADLCTLLQLDPERATIDDVLALVGGLLDAAGRLDRLRSALAEVAGASPATLVQTATAMRALREDGNEPMRDGLGYYRDRLDKTGLGGADPPAPVPTVAVRTALTTPPALRHRLDEVAAVDDVADLLSRRTP